MMNDETNPFLDDLSGYDNPAMELSVSRKSLSPLPHPSPRYAFSGLDGTLSGFRFNGPPTQGSSCLATLCWRTQSRWDCMTLNTYSPQGEGELIVTPLVHWKCRGTNNSGIR